MAAEFAFSLVSTVPIWHVPQLRAPNCKHDDTLAQTSRYRDFHAVSIPKNCFLDTYPDLESSSEKCVIILRNQTRRPTRHSWRSDNGARSIHNRPEFGGYDVQKPSNTHNLWTPFGFSSVSKTTVCEPATRLLRTSRANRLIKASQRVCGTITGFEASKGATMNI